MNHNSRIDSVRDWSSCDFKRKVKLSNFKRKFKLSTQIHYTFFWWESVMS